MEYIAPNADIQMRINTLSNSILRLSVQYIPLSPFENEPNEFSCFQFYQILKEKMFSTLAIGFVLICAIHGAPQPKVDERMTLDVYYESLCPDSRNFLVTQLNPNWPTLSTFTDLRLVPFGKATFVSNAEGGWNFECQHGPAECTGNILHACGIKYSPSVTQALNFTTCLMDAPTAGPSCAESAGLDYTPIDACQNSVEGQNLVHDYGVETLNLDPTLSFVPWLIYNKVWNESNQWESLTNLTGVACNNAPANTLACLV